MTLPKRTHCANCGRRLVKIVHMSNNLCYGCEILEGEDYEVH